MIRIMIITLANLALPFVIHALYQLAIKMAYKHAVKKGTAKDVTPPAFHVPWVKLLLIGVGLLGVTLFSYRLFGLEDTLPFVGNMAVSKDY